MIANKDTDKPTLVTSEVLQNYVISRRYYFSYRIRNQNQKCFYSILTKSIYKVTMKRFWIRGPLLRPAWSLT